MVTLTDTITPMVTLMGTITGMTTNTAPAFGPG